MPTPRLRPELHASEDTRFTFTHPFILPSPSKSRSIKPTSLFPSPQLHSSPSSSSATKENAPSSNSTTSFLSPRHKKTRPFPSTSTKNIRKVIFSPTPLPSLKASPKHKRTFDDLNWNSAIGGGGAGRPAKRIKRLGVYSNHPFLGLHHDLQPEGSSSPEEEEDASSPPTSPEEFGGMIGAGGSHSGREKDYFRMPFSFPGLSSRRIAKLPQLRPPVSRDVSEPEEDETDTATDSESESDFVSSLLLQRLPSSSSSISSSSPIKSPCSNLFRPPLPQIGKSSWLKGILKPIEGEVARAANENEGTRKNGRGRKHTIGWEDMRLTDGADSKASAGGSVGSKGIQKEREGKTMAGVNGSVRPVVRNGGDGSGDEGDEKRKKRQGRSAGKGNEDDETSGQQPNESSHHLARDDPILLRTPLLTLTASLRPVSADYIRPSTRFESLPTDEDAMAVGPDQYSNLFETPTCLTDVESAYVDLTRVIFQLPSNLLSSATTLQPLLSHRKEFVRCIARDVDNITNFPTWVKQTNSLSSPSSSPGSAAASSPIHATGSSPGSGGNGKAKNSLTEEQMGRLRDEIGVAQAGIKCVAAIMRDERVYSLFTPIELSFILQCVTSLPSASGLNASVQRDLFPFVPFLLVNQSLPSSIVSLLISPHILPALSRTLSLPHRVDRHRVTFGESLSAIALLLSTNGKEMLSNGNWKMWFRSAMLGLWDGPKKGISVKVRSLAVAGRLLKVLTGSIEWTEEGMLWVKEREQIARNIGEAMHALLNETPDDLVSGNRLQLLSNQWSLLSKTKADGTANIDEANLLFHLSLLSILPALLGSSFRKLEEKGIGPWIKPFNQISQTQTSIHVLATIALSWTNLAFAFSRSTSGLDSSESAWILRRRGDDNKALFVLSNIFVTRKDVWVREAGLVSPTKKERKRSHAKALALAFAASFQGLTVTIHHGVSSVRNLTPNLPLSPLSTLQLNQFDEIFDKLLAPTLPNLTRSPFVETSTIGWIVLTSILRPRSAEDRFAVLEDIVNPAILDTHLASARTTEHLDLVLATVFGRAFNPRQVSGWGSEWVQSRLERVLDLLIKCTPSSTFTFAEHLPVSTWNSLLDSTVDDDVSLARIINWLSELTCSSSFGPAGFVRDLWSATLAREEFDIMEVIESSLVEGEASFEVSATIFAAWSRMEAKPDWVVVALARGWRNLLQQSPPISTIQLETIVTLLQYAVSCRSFDFKGQSESFGPEEQCFLELAEALNARLWQGDQPELDEHLNSMLRPPSDTETMLQLCTLFVSASHNLEPSSQKAVLDLGARAVQSVLRSDTVRDEIVPLIADMVFAASDETYADLYEAVLDSLASIRPSNDALVKFLPLVTPSLDRAILAHAGAADAQGIESFGPRPELQSTLRPLLAFDQFWRKTYAQTAVAIDLPSELQELLKLLKELAHVGMTLEPEDSQLHSQLTQAIHTFSRAEEQHNSHSSQTVKPTFEVSTRDFDADVDESRFHRATGDASPSDVTTSLESRPAVPSMSLHGSSRQINVAVDANRGQISGSIVEETPNEVLESRSSSNASVHDGPDGDHSSEPEFAETLSDVKRRARQRKRQRSPELSATPSIVIGSSDEDELVVVQSNQSSSTATSRARKILKTPAKRRKTNAAKRPAVPQEIVEQASKAPAAVASPSSETTTRPRRSQGKGKAVTAAEIVPDSAVSTSSRASGATSESPHRPQDEEALRRVLKLPLGTVAQMGKLIGGTVSLQRLMAIGEVAKDYYEKIKRSPSR